MKSQYLIATAVLAALSTAAFTHAVPWTNSSGSTAEFSWSGGQSDNGLFGDPVIVGSSFIFSPTNFRAVSSNGVAQTTVDRLEVTLTANPGFDLVGIEISEIGDFSILGQGTVNAAGFMFVTNLTSGGTVGNAMVFNPTFPVSTSSAASGIWTGVVTQVFPDGTKQVRVVLNNILQAISGPNGTAVIEKKGTGIEVRAIIPEPASLGLVALAGLGLRRRRA